MDGLFDLGAIEGSTDRAAIGQLALRIVAQMAGAHQVESGQPGRDLTQMLARAARLGDPAVFSQLQAEFRKRRVTGERVIDVYIPAAVTLLGEAWHNDEISVLQATVAFARLQDLMRELGVACTADRSGRPDGPRVLVVVPTREQHTISALLATNQMRRMGVSVAIEFLAGPETVCERLTAQPFDAVFLSAANLRTVPTCEQIIKAMRRQRLSSVPVALGGQVACIDPALAGSIGADIVTTRVDEALMAFGLLAHCEAAQ